MKKVLLASTVLLAAGAVSAQAAEPLKLGIQGYMTQQLGYAHNDGHMNKADFDQQGYAEINFAGSTKLDNGITIAVRVDTYATQNGDTRNAAIAKGGSGNSNIRRAYMTVTSSYGQIVLGQREDYGATVHTSAPDQGWGLQDGDWNNFIANPSQHNSIYVTSNNRYSVRADKITLITPTWNGLQAGFTYTPDIATGRTGATSMAVAGDNALGVKPGAINASSFGGDQYQVGLAYNGAVGAVSVKSDLAYSVYNIGNMNTYQAGLQLGYAGFTLGGSYFYRDVDTNATVLADNGIRYNAAAALRAGQSYDVAIPYNNGPFGVSFGYFHDQSKGGANRNGAGLGVTGNSTDVYALSAKYTMGPGVDWRSSLYYVDYDNDAATKWNSVSGDTYQNDGVAFITGLKVSF